MKSFKEFALPKYPAQTDIKFKDDDWVVGDPDPEKAFEYDTSKDGYENMDKMDDMVDQDREKMK